MTEEKLERSLGRWDLTAIAINSIIGAGIFGLPAKAYALIGPYSVIALVACALVFALIVLCYCEVASRFDSTGGPYLYAKKAYGPVVGFEVGWLYWIVRVTTFAANCNLLVTYLGFFIPSLNDGLPRVVVMGMVVLVITVVNVLGVRQTAVLTNIVTAGKILPLLAFVAIGLFFLQPENFSFETVPTTVSFSAAVLLLVYAFSGFESATIVAGEVKEPERNFPFSLLVALGTVAVLYLLIQIVAIGTHPNLGASERPLADAANLFLGGFGASLIVAGAVVSIFGNLNVGALNCARLTYAMSEQRELPKVLSWVHPRFRTPYISILLNAVVVFVLASMSSFLTAVAISSITRLMVYGTTCGALAIFRWRSDSSAPESGEPRSQRADVPPARFVLPFGILVAALSLVLIAWLLTNIDFAKEGVPVLVASALGFAIYFAYRVLGKRGSDAPS